MYFKSSTKLISGAKKDLKMLTSKYVLTQNLSIPGALQLVAQVVNRNHFWKQIKQLQNAPALILTPRICDSSSSYCVTEKPGLHTIQVGLTHCQKENIFQSISCLETRTRYGKYILKVEREKKKLYSRDHFQD